MNPLIIFLTFPRKNHLFVTYVSYIPSQGGSHTPGRFKYNIKNDDIYKSTKVLSRDFRNLKTHVKRHFENEVHLKNDFDWQKQENYKGKCETQEHADGMRIARLCYIGYLTGSSKRNFEEEILKSVLNGLDVGDINHSSELYSNFMSFVSEQVTEMLKSFFSSRLDHTGCKPPFNLQADKGANVHKTRQFTTVVTVVPEFPKWLTHIYLGQPVFKSHDGPGVIQRIIDELNSWHIQGDQVEGGNFDGQFFHLSVPGHLTEVLYLSDQLTSPQDPLHKGSVVDNQIRKNSSFSLLVEMQTICSEIFSTFNWDKHYENFLQIYEDLDVQMKKPTNFQMKRFANSVGFVFINLRIDYSATRLELVNVITSKENSSAAKDRSKAKEAKCVLRKLNYCFFCFSLSGCADIYNVHGIFSNICQEVNLLPQERLDRVQDVIGIFSKMMKALDYSNCPGECL